MKFMLPDGKVVRGRSYESIVNAMGGHKFGTPQSNRTYRRATAQRALELHGVIVDDSTDKAFVQTLEQNGLLERV